ncbi:pleckstrin homology domain-containing family G member 3 isoform X3 [Rana temporaria]|uniref:pleckstrin homology domain-containing family G member 3 isoform X3 n=1 Tax=Rana temporaria TaxID=8407 RepID=UPI001AAD06F4|nr:pleckstrin homology domain-containing family G member 3 isoform X3 [Rana temporaria]
MEGNRNIQEDVHISESQSARCKDGTLAEEETQEHCALKTPEGEDRGPCLQDPSRCSFEESPRLSAGSSSSNEKFSSSASLSTDFYDSDRPVSLISTASSGSLREGRDLYEIIRPAEEAPLGNAPSGLAMELVSGDTLHTTFRDMQSGLKNSYTMNGNNNVNRRSHGSRSLSPFGTKVSGISNKLTYVERVVLEICETERMYVQDLRSIVEDYLGGIIDKQELPMNPEQVSALFGNIEDIYELNSELLQDLDSCRDDPVAVATCFVEKSQDFDIYTQYCNNYPNSVATLTECMRNKVLSKFFREKQELLKQPLPLGAYLLKPVQRILKYHLLLQEIAKHFDVNKEGYEVVEEAIETMTGVAWYINDMKRKHEHAVRQQEIQSLLLNWKGMDLTTYGELVLEGTFRVQRARSERTFFLFYKALLITKKRGDHFVYKTHIPCASLMLIESTRDSLCFTLTHYKNSKQQHNVQAKTVEEKRIWTHHIKKLILENHHAIIPQKAKEAILEMDAYPGRYKYSPERIKKTMSAIDPMVALRTGRRQSEPTKHILKHLGEKVGLKHAGSDGALLEFEDILQPNNGSLTPTYEQPQTEGDEERPASTELSRGSGAELSASEEENEEEIQLGDDEQNREHVQHETSKGFKRQNSQSSSGNPEKRRSVEVTAFSDEILEEMEKDHSESEEAYVAHMINSSENPLDALLEPSKETESVEEDRETDSDTHDPLDNGVTENAEDSKTFSSEEDEEEAAEHGSTSILPPSVLDQASVIAERFVNSFSRRSSLALEDGKVIGPTTPKLTSRSSSLINLDCTEKILYPNGNSDFPESYKDVNGDVDGTNSETTIIKVNSVENVFEEKERSTYKRRESILSSEDRQLLDKIKTYYDKAEHQDASFSIKRRESLSYIPAGLVRNSIFKLNSLPRLDQGNYARERMGSSSSNSNVEMSKPVSWEDTSTVTNKRDTNGFTHHTQPPGPARKNSFPEQPVPVSDEEFHSPIEMIKVWEEIEKQSSWNENATYEARKDPRETLTSHGDQTENDVESNEPLIIVEESDLSTITEESQNTTPEGITTEHLTEPTYNMGFSDQEYKTPIKLHPSILEFADSMEEDFAEKMKNKVYQLARQYSQRIKCNKPAPHRRLRDIEEDIRRGSLSSVQEEKTEEKCKLKPALSLPTYDHIVLQEHSPKTPTSASYSEKSPKRLSFTSESPRTSSPVRSDCKSPLSPVKTEKFHWPDVRELRSRYASTSGSSKSLPVNRSLSVPDKMMEHPSDTHKEVMSHSCNMNMKHSSSANGIADETNALGKAAAEGPNVNGKLESLKNSRNSGQTTADFYYISAEAPLENNKKVIVLEKLPTTTSYELENDDTYVHIRSPTTREKISLKAVVERCKAYQESDEYKAREELSRGNGCLDFTIEQPKPEARPATSSDAAQKSRVKNLREKFQSSTTTNHSEHP